MILENSLIALTIDTLMCLGLELAIDRLMWLGLELAFMGCRTRSIDQHVVAPGLRRVCHDTGTTVSGAASEVALHRYQAGAASSLYSFKIRLRNSKKEIMGGCWKQGPY